MGGVTLRIEDLSLKWDRYKVQHLQEMRTFFEKDSPSIGGADTEGYGLHIKKDGCFLVSFGWLVANSKKARVVVFPVNSDNMKTFFEWASTLDQFWWWNAKYDLHAMTNSGYTYTVENLCEGMALARLVFEAVPNRNGGDSLALKDVGDKYVQKGINESQRNLNTLLNDIVNDGKKVLYKRLKKIGVSKSYIDEFLKDKLNDPNSLPPKVRKIYLDWQKEFPKVSQGDKDFYAAYLADPDLMVEYAQYDVIIMMEFVYKFYPLMIERGQLETFQRENKLIYPLWRMERSGLKVDRNYLLERKEVMKEYILKKRKELCDLAGEEVRVGQHKRLGEIFNEKYGLSIEKSNKDVLRKISRECTGDIKKMSDTIMELRSLEKWYTTYLIPYLEKTEYDGRFYTSIQQCNAVSGRVGSDSQQFPKKGLYDDEGNELFNPRKMFIPTDQGKDKGYNRFYYLDFSQIELRNQADYTLRVSGGDPNLCSAYMPFNCKHYISGEVFDYKTVEGRSEWNQLKYGSPNRSLETNLKNGYSAWVDMKTKNPWIPTDVHAETTDNLLTALGYQCIEKYTNYIATEKTSLQAKEIAGSVVDEAKFKVLRGKLGKPFNFMANYGGTKKAAMQNLNLPELIADALVKAYYAAFPHIKKFQKAVIRQHGKNFRNFVQNMYKRRYYRFSDMAIYQLGNYLVQGTCADMMKECIITIDKLLTNYKTRLILTVHDELQFEVWKGEEYLIPQIKKIMETHEWHLVPIVADVEYTETNWSEKKDITLEELIS